MTSLLVPATESIWTACTSPAAPLMSRCLRSVLDGLGADGEAGWARFLRFWAFQGMVQEAEHIFVQAAYGSLLLCIPPGAVVGTSISQGDFGHRQGAERFAHVLLNAEFPLIFPVRKEERGCHVGNALGSCPRPCAVPVNESFVKVRDGDVAGDEHRFAFGLGDGYRALLQGSCRTACRKARGK